MLTRTLAALAVAAGAILAPAATAALPCHDMTMPLGECISPLRDKLQHLCFPPDVEEPYSC